jgi:hypothetical protein
MNLPPKEGVGNAGCPLHPRPRVHLVVVERTRVTTSTPESPDVPARNGFTTYFVLSPVIGLFCHRRQRIKVLSKPGRADLTSANLTPASGCQDHTTSPYAATSLVRVLLTAHRIIRTRPAIPSHAKRCRVHRIPPRVRDDGQRPSVGWDGGINKSVSTNPPSEIFFARALDTKLAGQPVGQISRPSRSIRARKLEVLLPDLQGGLPGNHTFPT